jgi:hypothetical protein
MKTKHKFPTLAPRFNSALQQIIQDNIAAKIVVKVTEACITFYYKIATVVKDKHRQALKNRMADMCVTTVHAEETDVKVTFSSTDSMFNISTVFTTITMLSIEIVKELPLGQALVGFLQDIYGKTSPFVEAM